MHRSDSARAGEGTPRKTHATVHAAAKAATKTHATDGGKPTGFRGNPSTRSCPQPLQWQLAHHKVVVVSLYNPSADVDAISVAEAHAGAIDASAGFLLVNVLDNKVAGILTALLPGGGLLPDPGVLRLPRARRRCAPARRLRRPRVGRAGGDERAVGRDRPAATAGATTCSTATGSVVNQSSETTGRELFVRHAKKDGRSVTILRAVDYGSSCVVEAEVFPAGCSDTVKPGPYTFADAAQATAFVTEAVESLMYLGCDVYAE